MSKLDGNGTRRGATPERDAHGVPLLPGLSPSRRAFLKLVGFSFAGAALQGCSRGQDHEAVPFLERPEAVTPGTAQLYAGACGGCSAGCGTLVKVRDGRPIKIEGNDLDATAQGRTCAVGQAQVLSLYDAQRLRGPLAQGRPSTWTVVDGAVRERLAAVRKGGKAVRVLTGTTHSPTERAAIQRFLADYPDGGHVTYDALSASALLAAHEACYGERLLPRYRLENATVIVGVDADFLGTWISPVEFARGWRAARALEPGRTTFAHHAQFESRVSLTGTNADRRVPILPGERPLVLAGLAQRVAAARGVRAPWGQAPAPAGEEVAAVLDDLARRLVEAPRGRALVLCGANDAACQTLTCFLNHVLDATDTAVPARTVDLERTSLQKQGDDRALEGLLAELETGRVGALLVAGCNPVYDLPRGEALGPLLDRVDLVVSFAERQDETAAHARYVCPDHHPLEAWRDGEPIEGRFTLSQPAIRPLGDTRALVESLAAFAGEPATAYEQVRALWRERILPRAGGAPDFEVAWHRCVHDGVLEAPAAPRRRRAPTFADVGRDLQAVGARGAGELDLVLYPKLGLLDGRHAHNPWLQELPDPISKVSWDNYASLAPATADVLGLKDGDLVRVEGVEGGGALELPALRQPGQAPGTVAVALGYGRAGTDRFAAVGPAWLEGRPTIAAGERIGVNAAALLTMRDGHLAYDRARVAVRRGPGRAALARRQIFDSLDVPAHLAPGGQRRREIVQQATWEAWREDPGAGARHEHAFAELWTDDHPYAGRHWGLAIDLSACTGCAACVIACQAENNVPVVGKDEVRRQRDMHWIRIDRYFQGDGADLETVHQPMMCQQCDHAPCETVCPVLATVHGSEGLNEQVYNRCVGTRYCSNNCPYKVRRFNWFDYPREDRLQNMVLNPDVTVRSRGVMEKCTFCVQRIAEGKARAKRENDRPVADGDVQTACMQVCPAGAIVFGDMNDPQSEVTRQMKSPRAFRVLGELGVQPSVAYLTQVKDRPGAGEERRHG